MLCIYRKGSVTYGPGADISLPHCLNTSIWGLAHKSDHRVEISRNIVRYDALALRPKVVLCWYLVSECAFSPELNFLPYEWENLIRGQWQLLVPVFNVWRIRNLWRKKKLVYKNQPFLIILYNQPIHIQPIHIQPSVFGSENRPFWPFCLIVAFVKGPIKINISVIFDVSSIYFWHKSDTINHDRIRKCYVFGPLTF